MILAALMLFGNLADSSRVAAKASPEANWEGAFLRIRIPSQVLLDPEVRRILQSGLTTSFALDFSVARAHVGRHARLEVRYEPWDEIYLASLLSEDNQKTGERLASFASLVEWWEKLRFNVLRAQALEGVGRADLKVTLSVVPFSATEERDARRWFAQSIGESRSTGSPPVGGGPAETQDPRDHLLDALITTSIKRRVLRTFRWTVSIPEQVRR